MLIGGRRDRSTSRNPAAATLLLVAIGAAPVPAAASDAVNGLALAELMCTRCHVVGPGLAGGRKGPRLPNTVNRKALDADALRAWLHEAHQQMPNFSLELTQKQIEDIAAYLDTLRVR